MLTRMIAAGLGPTIIVETESGPLSGGPDAVATVCTSDFEVFRSRGSDGVRGPRSSAYEWTGEPAT